jgi:hypothetical protein
LTAIPCNGLERKIQLIPSKKGFISHTCFYQFEVYTECLFYNDFKKLFLNSLEIAQAGVFIE